MKTLSIIIPCYNEENVVDICYAKLCPVLESLDMECRILFVNDGSVDGTKAKLTQLSEQDNRITVINFSRNFGQQAAVTAGIHHCKSDFAIIMDADMQDPPALIPKLIEKQIQENANVVYGVRRTRLGESRFKVWSSRSFYRTLNRLSNDKFPLDSGDFRLIDRTIMNHFNSFKEREKYVRGLISWVGFKQVPLDYERDARIHGESKYSLKKMLSFGVNALTYFSHKPLHIAMSLGFVAVIVGIIMALWSIFGKFFGYTDAESGWTSIIITIIFFGGVQLLTIGVLGRYIGTLFNEVKERPEYIIEDILN
ncbi:glycosyltransferase family 2 protein [Bacteroidales bacterium OttesenSCG-928-M11]|nr:glycosyltransferase family 2 protein [Bacteroidales bacterium OttesenSCG-928-M11]